MKDSGVIARYNMGMTEIMVGGIYPKRLPAGLHGLDGLGDHAFVKRIGYMDAATHLDEPIRIGSVGCFSDTTKYMIATGGSFDEDTLLGDMVWRLSSSQLIAQIQKFSGHNPAIIDIIRRYDF